MQRPRGLCQTAPVAPSGLPPASSPRPRFAGAQGVPLQPAGLWKPADNVIADHDADGNLIRTRFRPVSAVGTPGAMGDLVRGYRLAMQQREDPLIVVPPCGSVVVAWLFTVRGGRIARRWEKGAPRAASGRPARTRTWDQGIMSPLL